MEIDSETKTVEKPNSFVNFIVTIIRETIIWFFRGLGSCASSFLGFLFVVFALFFVLALFSSNSGGTSDVAVYDTDNNVYRDFGGDDKIAIINLDGLIVENDGSSSFVGGSINNITPDGVYKILKTAKSDDKIKAVILYISSPGGSPVASDRIFQEIMDFKNDTKMPVVVMMGDVAASGGYYISSAADFIFANPSTITGSIGVILETYNLSGLYDKIGVKKETFKSGKYKDILSDARDITPEERQMINSLMSDTYENFLKRVSEGRGMSLEDVQLAADGKIYSGLSAVDAGLIDDTGTLDDAIAHTAASANLTKFKVVKLKGTSLFDEFFGQISYTAKTAGVGLGLIGINQPKYQILYKLP